MGSLGVRSERSTAVFPASSAPVPETGCATRRDSDSAAQLSLHQRQELEAKGLRCHLAFSRLGGLIDDRAQRALEGQLIMVPESGAVIAGTGGVRKLRFGVGGRGKRGGLRVVYYYRRGIGRIYLITVYAKNASADLTMAQKRELRQITALLDQEGL